MNAERETAVLMMQNMGWTAKRELRGKTPIWKFSRPDTGGLWDVAMSRQDQLSLMFVVDKAMAHGDADALVDSIRQIKRDWLITRFRGIGAAPA